MHEGAKARSRGVLGWVIKTSFIVQIAGDLRYLIYCKDTQGKLINLLHWKYPDPIA